jgi:hypothetical protein
MPSEHIINKKNELLENKIKMIQDDRPFKNAKQYSGLPQQEMEMNKIKISEGIIFLENIHQKSVQHIKSLRKYIKEPAERTKIWATYLLLGKIMTAWESIFILAKNGIAYETMEILRSIAEKRDLVLLFTEEKDAKFLNQWLNGKIIDNSKARKIMGELDLAPDIDIEKMAADIYHVQSSYTHGSYSTLLECWDIYQRDFDWSGYARHNYLRSSLQSLYNEMYSTLSVLRYVFLNQLQDTGTNDKICEIMVEIDNRRGIKDEELERVVKAYKKNK